MWVCPQCYEFNDGLVEQCANCQARKPDEEVPKGRKEHRNASYIKDKKTMYTHPGPFGWKLAKTNDSELEQRIHSCKADYKVVAVLDIGTCFSGYGYSLRSDPTKNQHITKVPTCLLIIKNEKKTKLYFGFAAIDRYRELEKSGRHLDCYFFQTFKTDLSERETISFDMMIKDISGKEMEAQKVFTFTLINLKNCLLSLLKKDGINVALDEIRWVVPVPTTWNDAAKQFIRRLADIVVDIPEDQLLLSVEPEAASISRQFQDIQLGTKYMVVSLGGGTTDVIVHEKTSNNGVKELVRGRGGNFGGYSVNQKFLELLENIVGDKVMTEFQKNYPVAYLNLLLEFEKTKMNISNDENGTGITIPRAELESKCKEYLGRNLLSAVQSSRFSLDISLQDNTLIIKNILLKGLFTDPIKETISTMREIFNDPETAKVSNIVLVGGFASSPIVQEAIRSEFNDKTLIVSEEPSLSAINGSFAYGHDPAIVQSRVMKYSYGVGISDDFDPSKHDKSHCLVQKDGSKLAIHIFDVIVRKNQMVEAGTVVESEYLTIERNQKSMEFELYISINENPSYIDEIGSRSLGSVVLPFPDIIQGERNVKVSFVIGNTEIELRAEDKISGQKISVEFDLV